MTNNLQLQDVYSIRGLNHGTTYDLKARLNTTSNILQRGETPNNCWNISQVTAHNHAGSTTQLYTFTTLNAFGHPALSRGGLAGVLEGLGLRASLSIVISILCLVLASLGVCFCIRKSEWKLRLILSRFFSQPFFWPMPKFYRFVQYLCTETL